MNGRTSANSAFAGATGRRRARGERERERERARRKIGLDEDEARERAEKFARTFFGVLSRRRPLVSLDTREPGSLLS